MQTADLKASLRHPSMKVEVTHFSDVVTADKLREIEKNDQNPTTRGRDGGEHQ